MYNVNLRFLAALSVILTFYFVTPVFSQTNNNASASYRCVFYNIENYFDTAEDTISGYNEFTPDGNRRWTYSRYKQKRNQLYKVIIAIGEWNQIALLGLAEIENRSVLEDLIEYTPLNNKGFDIVHFESDDRRGIDVGLIYDTSQFAVLESKPYKVKLQGDFDFITRDILYVKGLFSEDTLHVLINHWPSRYGGYLQTKPLRLRAAQVCRQIIDSICHTSNDSNILVMGDMNDDPDDESIKYLTGAEKCLLSGISLMASNKLVKGTMKYQGKWENFDQIISSENLLDGESGLAIKNGNGTIYDAAFLLEADQKYLGLKPKRTYSGFKYNAGISDHLPIFVDIYSVKPK